jgi:hypothetical protein
MILPRTSFRSGVLLVALLAVLGVAQSAQAATTTLVKANCAAVWAGPTSMIFNERQPDGRMDVRIGNRDCSGSKPLLPAHDGHRGVSDVTADGRYAVLETAFGPMRNAAVAESGRGVGNQLQLLDRTTGRLTTLTSGRQGTIWARLHPSGKRVTWSEMVKDPLSAGIWDHMLGIWSLHVADITPAGTLTNERTWQNAADPGFVETYGWLGDKLMFASDSGVSSTNKWMGKWYASQLWTIPDTLGSGVQPQRVSPEFTQRTWWGGTERHNAYHEFMHVAPAGMFSEPGPWILTSIGWDTAPYGGLDLWRMRPDGSGRERLTRFNAGRYAVTGALAFDPLDPKRIFLHVARDWDAKDIDLYDVRLP